MKKILLLLILTTIFSWAHADPAHPDDPLIFRLETPKGQVGCLVAVTHLVVRRSTETEDFLKCARNSSAVVLEADITTSGKPDIWSGYAVKSGDPSFTSLTKVVQKRVRAALEAAQYTKSDIEYLLTLHPMASYRALQFSRLLSPEHLSQQSLQPNIDILVAVGVKERKFPIFEMEGMPAFYDSERNIDIRRLEELLSKQSAIFLSKELLNRSQRFVKDYIDNLQVQPDVDTAWKKKLQLNTQAFGLPEYSIIHDVDQRNELMAAGLVKIISKNSNVLAFIGAAHVGGPNSFLIKLQQAGIKVTRLR